MTVPSQPPAAPLLTDLLQKVSRSFYLTLRILPRTIRPQIGLAYLLARAADTIADTEFVSVERRLEALDQLRRRILKNSDRPLEFGALTEVTAPGRVAGQGVEAERVLLQRAEEVVRRIDRFTSEDQARIREVLDTITGGQILDLQRFGGGHGQEVACLESEDELDDYTYRVAGCVGEFWTRLCRAHLFPRAAIDDRVMLQRGIRFGKGLQLVNILRDLPSDLRQGRCYLPRLALQTLHLTPSDLLHPEHENAVRPVLDRWLDQAWDHLDQGWQYTCSLPSRCLRLRLACAWPVLIGARTLEKLRQSPMLAAQHRVKVSRAEVKQIMWGTLWRLPFPRAWNRLFPNHKRGHGTST